MGFFSETNSLIKLIKSIINFIKEHKSKKRKKQIAESYYYEETHKNVYIKSNGNGVIVCSVKLHVSKIDDSFKLTRTFDISDAKASTVFPHFESMLQNGNSNPFNEFGLWYCSDSNIVTNLEEYYNDEDKKTKNKLENKFLSFNIILNQSALEKDKDYNIMFALSIPGMYPIKNGRFDGTIQEKKNYGNFESSLHIYNTRKLIFNIYMEQNMVFNTKPVPYVKNKTTGKYENYPCKYENNMIYEKISCTLDDPKEYDKICMNWDLKNQKPKE